MAWVAQSERVSVPIIGATAAEQIDAAVQASELRLDETERRFLEDPYRPRDEINDANPLRRPRALNRVQGATSDR
jgi:1-deoxyxylulose-5-phosphate synthase